MSVCVCIDVSVCFDLSPGSISTLGSVALGESYTQCVCVFVVVVGCAFERGAFVGRLYVCAAV